MNKRLPAVMVFLSLLPGCSRRAVPTDLGQSVPFGDGQLTISAVEKRSTPKSTELAVFFQWTGATKDLLSGSFSGPKLRMEISDHSGKAYKAIRPDWSVIAPMPESAYRLFSRLDLYEPQSREGYAAMAEDSLRYHSEVEKDLADAEAGRNPIRWVQVFRIDPNSSGFTLVATNPNRSFSQPAAISVDLGR